METYYSLEYMRSDCATFRSARNIRKCNQNLYRTLRICNRHEDVVMIIRGHHIAAYILLRQRPGHGRRQPDRFERGVDRQGDPGAYHGIRQRQGLRLLPGQDDRGDPAAERGPSGRRDGADARPVRPDLQAL